MASQCHVSSQCSLSSLAPQKKQPMLSPNAVGLLGAGISADMLPQAIGQWTQQLAKTCSVPRSAPASFAQAFAKRVAVLEALHYARMQAFKAALRTEDAPGDSVAQGQGGSSVPFVVRMSVLSLFPLIEAISAIQGPHYERVCDSTISILLQVLEAQQPCALASEPLDCLQSFHDFALGLIQRSQFAISSLPRVQLASKALVALSVCSGDSGQILSAAEMLLRAQLAGAAVADTTPLVQLGRFEQKGQMPILSDDSFLGEWTVEGLQTQAASIRAPTAPAAVATDGQCVFVHAASHGIVKFGTGDAVFASEQSARGHVYASNSQFRRDDKASSLAYVGGLLFYFAPPLPAAKPAPSSSLAVGAVAAIPSALNQSTSGASSNKDATKHVLLSVVDPIKLVEISTVQLDIASSSDFFPLTSDGRYLYVVYQVESPSTSASSQSASAGSASVGRSVEFKVMVNMYLPEGSGAAVKLRLVRTVELHVAPSAKEPRPGPGVSASHWDTSCFFSTGVHMGVLVPQARTRSHDPYAMVRVFELPSGKFLAEHSISAQPFGVGVCYDVLNNVVRVVCPTTAKCASWINFGRQPWMQGVSPWDVDPFSWAAMVEAAPKDWAGGAKPATAAFALLTHMDRLSSLLREWHRPFLTEVVRISSTLSMMYDDDGASLSSGQSVLSSALAAFSSLRSSSNHQASSQNTFNNGSATVRLGRCVNLFRHATSLAQLLVERLGKEGSEVSSYGISCVFRLLAVHASQITPAQLASQPSVTKPVFALLQAACKDAALPWPVSPANAGPLIQQEAAIAYAACLRACCTPEQLVEQVGALLAHATAARNITSLVLNACLRMLVEGKETSAVALLLLTDSATGPVSNVALVEQFLSALLAYTCDVSFARSAHASLGHVALLPDLQLLLTLQKVLFSSAKLKKLASFYVKTAFWHSCRLAEAASQLPPADRAERTQCSFLALGLPALVACLSRAPLTADFEMAESFLPQLLTLVKSLDVLSASVPLLREADMAYLNRSSVTSSKKEPFRVTVESQHPYSRGRNQLQHTVTVPDARSISLQFDPRCRTLNSGSDMLQLFLTPNLSAAVLGPDKNGLVYSGTNWPKQRIVIEGNTVTFLFSAGSRNLEDPGIPAAHRWGFKCVVTEFKEETGAVQGAIQHWMLDLTNAIGVLCSRQVASFLAGEPTSAEEQRCQVWLSSRHFTGGRDESNQASPENVFLQTLAEGQAPHPLYVWLKSKQRRMASPQAAVHLEHAERLLLAAMLKHLGLVRDAMEFCNLLRGTEEPANSPHTAKLLVIGDETLKTFKWLMERGQLENQWMFAVADRKTDTTDFLDLPPEKLKMLCKMKRVPFSLMNIEDTHRHLLGRLRQDIENSDSGAVVPANPHETVCRPVVERARFLLQLLPTQKVVDYPTAVSSNPFAARSTASLTKSHMFLEGSHDSQQVELMIEDNGDGVDDDAHFSNMPLFRSASYFPKTDTAKDQELLKEKNEQKSKEFTRRVKELRQWLDAYSSWKSWRQGVLLDTVRGTGQTPLPRSPIPAISSFVKSDLRVAEMLSTLTLHSQRAARRVTGLTFLHDVLRSVSFGSVRQHVLAGLRPSLSSGAHYMDRIEACGRRLSADVEKAFAVLLQDMADLIGSSSVDMDSRLAAIEVCGMRFRCFDAGTLSHVGLLRTLMSVVVETSPTEVALGVQPMDIDEVGGVPRKDKEELDAVPAKASSPSPPAAVAAAVSRDDPKIEALRKASWTAFRLVAAQCMNWGTDDIILNPAAVDLLRKECFSLLARELKRVAAASALPEERGQLGELLSLVYMLLAQCSLGLDVLAEADSVVDLVLVLQGQHTPPESKRLALRLVRQLLPRQSEQSFRSFVSLCFSQITRWLIGGLADPANIGSSDAVLKKVTSPRQSQLQAPKETAAIPGSTPSDLFVIGWTGGASRLFEELFNNMGPEFMANFSGGVPNPQPDVVVRRIMDDMARKGRALLLSGTHDDCLKYTKLLGQFGCTLIILPGAPAGQVAGAAQASSASPAETKPEPPLVPVQTSWTSGHAAFSLASQFVSLVRSLAANTRFPQWARIVQEACAAAMGDLHAIDRALSSGSTEEIGRSNVLAALCVVGGFTETLRIGSRVEITGDVTSSKTGTLLSFSDSSDGTANIVLDNDVSRSLQKVPVTSLVPVPEFAADSNLLQLTPDILGQLLRLLHNPLSPSDSTFCAFLRADLRSRCMQALSSLVRSQHAAELFLHHASSSSAGLDALMTLARACEPSWSLPQQEQQATAAVSQLWDLATRPVRPESLFVGVRTVGELLPYFPFGGPSVAQDILPTCLDATSVDGAVFFGTDFLEMYLEQSSQRIDPSGGRSRGGRGGGGGGPRKKNNNPNGPAPAERLILADAPIPENCARHYWEVEIIATKFPGGGASAANIFAQLGMPNANQSGGGGGSKDTIMSVGLAPVGSRAWGDGSYHYQSDSKRAHFVDGVVQRVNYGPFFKAKSVVGCLWDKEEKIITFSHNGVSLGPAFTDVSGGRLVPCIGVSSGVHFRVNFGQQPFRFDSTTVRPGVPAPVEDEETRKKREEETARIEAERLQEEVRCKQEEESLYAARKDMAMQIVAIGFPLHHAMRALAAVEYNVEAAVNWALEHEAEPEDEPAPAPIRVAAPVAAAVAAPAPSPAASASGGGDGSSASSSGVASLSSSQQGIAAIAAASAAAAAAGAASVSAEDKYNPKASRSFWMEDNFSYSNAPDADGGKKSPIAIWEETVLPEVRAFMEGEEFGSVIIEDHLQQIRNAVSTGQEAQAKQIVQHIFNGAHSIRFPNDAPRPDASGGDFAELTLDDVRIGRPVVLSSTRPESVEAQHSLLGHAGIVRAWDADRKSVLLEFYDAEGGLLRQLWAPLSNLSVASAAPAWSSGVSVAGGGYRQLLSGGIRSYRCLASLHARRAVLALLRHTPVRPGKAEELLQLAGAEYLNCDVFHPNDAEVVRAMDGMAAKLRSHVAALRVTGSGVRPLEDACERLMLSAAEFAAKNTLTVTHADANSGADTYHISIKGARTMVITFAKMCFLPTGASAKMGFYADAECTEPVKVYEQGRRLAPFVVRSSELWFRLHCNAAKRSTCKFSFNVTPCVPGLVLSVWLVDFLLQNYAESGELDFQRLFDMTLKAFWENAAPTVQKRVLAELMARILRCAKVKTGKMWERVFAEVQSLLENDKNILVGTYTQMLMELLVWERVPCELAGPAEPEENLSTATVAELKETGAKDEDLEIAISMAKAMGEREDEKPRPMDVDSGAGAAERKNSASSDENGGEEMDEELRLALQMSIAVPDDKPANEAAAAPGQPAAAANAVPPAPPMPAVADLEPPQKKQAGSNLKQKTLVSLFGAKVQPAAKATPDPAWLQHLTSLARTALVLSGQARALNVAMAGNVAALYEAVLAEPWKGTQLDQCGGCLLVVEDLPVGCSISAVSEALMTAAPSLTRLLREPPTVWPETGHAFLETVSPLALVEAAKVLAGKVLELGEGKKVAVKISDAELTRGIVKIRKSTRPQDEVLRNYLSSRLLHMAKGEPTEALVGIIGAIFTRFSSLALPENASLDMQELASIGEPLIFQVHLACLRAICLSGTEDPDPDAVAKVLAAYETRRCGSAVALTQGGFRSWVVDYAKKDPMALWADLLALGYDWMLRWSSFPVMVEAVHSTTNQWSPARDAAFAEMLEEISVEAGVRGPTQLQLALIHSERRGMDLNPHLRGLSTPDLRLRFSLLSRFNALLGSSLKYICFDSSRFKDSLGSLISSCRAVVWRQVKMTWAFEVMAATAVEGNQPAVVIERLRLASKQEQNDNAATSSATPPGVEDTVNTSQAVQSTAFGLAMQQLRGVDRAVLRQRKPPGTEPHFSLKIVFQGENVEGQGGPYRQFFTDVVNELRDRLPLLVPCPNAQSGVGKYRDRYIVCPSVKSAVALEMYEFLGVLMGCALRTGVYVNIDLAPIFWKTLTGLPLTKADLKDIDKSFYGTLEWWRLCAEGEWESDYNFTTTLSDKSSVELRPGGASQIVSYSQRLEWIELALKARLEEGSLQMKYVMKGLHSVVPAALFELFTHKDLEWRVCGSSIINVDLLQRHTEYNLITADAPVVVMFWETLRELTQEDLRRFVRFAWGQERLPVDDDEWKRTNTRMMIKPYMRTGVNADQVFPRSDTCFFNLELPNYSSKAVLKHKLLTAISLDSDSMDADVREDDQFANNPGGRGLGGRPGGGRGARRHQDISSMLSFGAFGGGGGPPGGE